MKKQRRQSNNSKVQEKPVTLGDLLNDQLTKQLKEKKQELQEKEEKLRKEEEERKKEERKLKEKNKSFEELLNETSLNWKDYK